MMLGFGSLSLGVVGLLGLVAIVAVVVAAYMMRRADKREIQQHRDANATRERMRDAENEHGDDPDVLRDWLRDRGKR